MGDVARRASTHAGFVVASAHMPRVATVKAPKATARKSLLRSHSGGVSAEWQLGGGLGVAWGIPRHDADAEDQEGEGDEGGRQHGGHLLSHTKRIMDLKR